LPGESDEFGKCKAIVMENVGWVSLVAPVNEVH